MDELLGENVEDILETGELLLATIGSINSSGATLIFDGQTSATTKRYKVLVTGNTLYQGQRVLVAKHSGTYLVLGRFHSNGKPFCHWTNTWSEIGTATSYFTIGYLEYAETGRIAEIRIKGTIAEALPSGQWTNLFTIASGKRPVLTNHYFNDYYNDSIQLKDDGTVSAWGLAADKKVDFAISYILE